jgi:orotidine-5'-phosphate decarboxylase
MVDTARKHDAGLFVLALTSNPEGAEVQEASGVGGIVADTVLDRLRELNEGVEPLGSFGAVVGATIDRGHHDLDINGPLLAPGYGAQGGTNDSLRRIFGDGVGRVLPSTSRDLLRAGPAGLAEAADRLNDRLRELVG